MILQSNPSSDFLRNAQRVISLFKKSIDSFNQKNMPELANQWKRILQNYERAVKARISA